MRRIQRGPRHRCPDMAKARHQPGRTQPQAGLGQHASHLRAGKFVAQGAHPQIAGIQQIAARLAWFYPQQVQQLRQLYARHAPPVGGQAQHRGKAVVIMHGAARAFPVSALRKNQRRRGQWGLGQ